jgi:hypothetical protein
VAPASGTAFAHVLPRMAPTVKWTIAPDFVKVAAFGEATRDDIVAAIVGATRNPRFVRGMGLLVDGRALKDEGGSCLSHDDLREKTDGIAALGFGRCALIAGANASVPSVEAAPPPTYGLPTGHFSDPGSAERWLSIRGVRS